MIRIVTDSVDPGLEQELETFERSFRYPLGVTDSFVISHGPDYPRFFQAMGEATSFVARDEGGVAGVLTTVVRTLRRAHGSPRRALYICDLKVRDCSRRGWIYLQLVKAALERHRRHFRVAYSVVMDGTVPTPDQYSGALGIPPFQRLAGLAVLRIPTQASPPNRWARLVTPKQTEPVFRKLTAGGIRTSLGSCELRSNFPATGLLTSEGAACGVLEDTLRGKRLYTRARELVSGHLSNYAYQDVESGTDLVRTALALCHKRGLPALFLSLPLSRLDEWLAAADLASVDISPASVYGTGLAEALNEPWYINTAEV